MKLSFLLDNNRIMAWGLGFCYAVGVLNTVHYHPDTSFFGSAVGAIILAISLMIVLWRNPPRSINLSSLTWAGLFLLLIFQPLINNIAYVDALLFPIVALFLTMVLSVCVFNLDDKQLFIKNLAVIILSVGFLTLLAQVVQLLVSSEDTPFVVSTLTKGRPPYGNVNQQNVTAYVLSLSIAALFYIYHEYRLSIFLLFGCVFLLSMGDGFTASRGGVILFTVALLVMTLLHKGRFYLREKIILFLGVGFVASLGYFTGAWLVDVFLGIGESGVERFSSSGIHHRLSLLNQAWLAIKSAPITGVGWGNYAVEGLKHVENLKWFVFATHAHSVFPQITAELGLIGFLATVPVVTTILLAIRLSLSTDKLFVLAVVVLTGLYSFSEFPLWFFYFLALASAFVACLDNNRVGKLKKTISIGLIIFNLLIAIGSVYYIVKYFELAKTVTLMQNKEISYKVKQQIYQQQENVFGFSLVKESMLFYLLPLNKEKLEQKILLGQRVVSHRPYITNIMWLARLYAFNGDARSLALYKSACLYGEGAECANVTAKITFLANKYPSYFKTINEQYLNWLKTQKIEGNINSL